MHTDLNCDHCEMGEEESQAHAMRCQGWEKERRGLDLETIEDTMQFFTRICKRRGRRSSRADPGGQQYRRLLEKPSRDSARSWTNYLTLDAVLNIDR